MIESNACLIARAQRIRDKVARATRALCTLDTSGGRTMGTKRADAERAARYHGMALDEVNAKLARRGLLAPVVVDVRDWASDRFDA